MNEIAALLVQGSAPQTPIPGLITVLSIIGAVVDWRYKRAGGQRSTRRDWMYFLLVVLVEVGFVVWIYVSGSPAIAGHVTAALLIFTFGAWELGRWRVRCKHPLPPKPTAQP